jgi:hypothetical protein
MAYYKSVFQIEILSNEPYENEFPTLNSLHHDITTGHCSGYLTLESEELVTKEQMHVLLENQGSDPTFLDDDYEYTDDEFNFDDILNQFDKEQNEKAYDDAQKFIL